MEWWLSGRALASRYEKVKHDIDPKRLAFSEKHMISHHKMKNLGSSS